MSDQDKMFTTDLSTAADSYLETYNQIQRLKENLEGLEQTLIKAMKRSNTVSLDLGKGILINYKFVCEKEKLSVKIKKSFNNKSI